MSAEEVMRVALLEIGRLALTPLDEPGADTAALLRHVLDVTVTALKDDGGVLS